METSPLDVIRQIERIITEEVDQPGTNEDRFRALLRAQKVARAAIASVEQVQP